MRLVLAHGASGNAASMRPHVDGLRGRGIEALAIDLPVRRAEDAVAAYRAAARPGPEVAVGGHSYGGRVASLLAADPDTDVAGLVLLSYPLHRPGHPAWEERSAHWASLRCPVLLLSGESDPFARIDLLRRAASERLPAGELHTWPGQRHGLAAVLDEALDLIADFVGRLAAAAAAGPPRG